ncbi:MAG: T9SS type A sorting domain-containing protein, partial [Fibrobacteres bacterium]|nr:T9SS type A sorting domain-containing protein [Fibrobacterota bacterium]
GGPYSAPVAGVSGACYYNPDTDVFGYTNVSSAVSVGNVGCRLAYDPVNDVAVMPDSINTYVYDFSTNRWTSRAGGVGKSTYVYHRTVFVNSIGKMLYLKPTISGTDSFMAVCLYDYTNNQWIEQSRVPGPAYRWCKFGLAYDSINDIVLMVAGQLTWGGKAFSDMWAYHPSENRWEALSPAPIGGKKPTSEILCTVYNPKDNVFVMSCNEIGTLFAYRYKKVNQSAVDKLTSNLKTELGISPNPFNPIVRIVMNNASGNLPVDYAIVSSDGRCVLSKSVAGKMVWNATGYPSGVYIVRAKFRDEILTRRIVLAK